MMKEIVRPALSAFRFFPNIISIAEENALLEYLNNKLSRRRYQDGHWDDVIKRYKETEMNIDAPPGVVAMNDRIRRLISRTVFGDEHDSVEFLPVHVLDLSHDGSIQPHVDSVKFSGDVVAGLSLLSTRILRLDEFNDSNMNELPDTSDKKQYEFMLPPRSLYILSGPLRYQYAHSIYGVRDEDDSFTVRRRLSLIYRDVLKENV
jgi:alkylated DNA repair protein alkB family protein 7